MLELAKNNPERFLAEYAVDPALKLIAQKRNHYEAMVKAGERSEKEHEAFFDSLIGTVGLDPDGNPQNLPWLDEIRLRFRQSISPSFCQFTKIDDFLQSGGEIRLYVSIKQDSSLELLRRLSGILRSAPSIFAFKINIGQAERNENAVIYLSDQADNNEIRLILGMISEIGEDGRSSGKDAFLGFDFDTPFSRPLIEGRSLRTIGQLAYNPFMSRSGKVELIDGGRGQGASRTVNQLYSNLVQAIEYYNHDGGSSDDLARKIMEQIKISCHFADGRDDRQMELIDYCRLCLDRIDSLLDEAK